MSQELRDLLASASAVRSADYSAAMFPPSSIGKFVGFSHRPEGVVVLQSCGVQTDCYAFSLDYQINGEWVLGCDLHDMFAS